MKTSKTVHYRWLFSILLPSVCCLVFASQTRAQDHFDVQHFNPAASQSLNFFGASSGAVLEDGRWDVGLMINYASNPLVVEDENGEELAGLVTQQLVANLIGAYGIADFFEIGIDIPLFLMQDGEDFALSPELEATSAGFGIGSIRLIPKVRILGENETDDTSVLSLAFLLDSMLPTGNQDDYQSEGFRIEPRFALDLATSVVSVGLNVGYLVRPETEMPDLYVDDTLTWAVGASVPLLNGDIPLELVSEIFGEVSILADDIGGAEAPLEFLAGIKVHPTDGVLVQAGGGSGIVNGFGSPDFRVFLGVSIYQPTECDTDGDGICDDSCPDDPEDFDQFEDEDGCPDPDNDEDTILDVDDSCPMDPEDFDTFEDENGCPDPDNDEDGILDADDSCPMDPEDYDLFEDEDGCPDPDNDEDSILDIDDFCPMDPEVINGFEDEDGCPDESFIVVTCTAIEIDDTIYFETDSDVIRSISFELLDQVAATIIAIPNIRLISIEGHTDSRGSSSHNLDLSRRRAASVLRYLEGQGVEGSRMVSEGFGEDQPIATNDTDLGMATNRRVEFRILEQEGCSD